MGAVHLEESAPGPRPARGLPTSARRRRRPRPASGDRLRVRHDASGPIFPEIGRYTTPEPLHAATARRLYGPQAYSYAAAQPLRFVDPSGRSPVQGQACSTIGPVTICVPSNGMSMGLVGPVGPAGAAAARGAAAGATGAGTAGAAGTTSGLGAGAFWGGAAAAASAALAPIPGGVVLPEPRCREDDPPDPGFCELVGVDEIIEEIDAWICIYLCPDGTEIYDGQYGGCEPYIPDF